MQSSIYMVFHVFDMDGFDGAISAEKPLGVFDTKEAAEKFAADNSDEHLYDEYADLRCGRLVVEERPVFSSAEEAAAACGRMWWKRAKKESES